MAPEQLHLHVGALLLDREPEPLGTPMGGVEELAGAGDLGVAVEQLAQEIGAAVRPREHHEVPPVVPVVRAAQVRACEGGGGGGGEWKVEGGRRWRVAVVVTGGAMTGGAS